MGQPKKQSHRAFTKFCFPLLWCASFAVAAPTPVVFQIGNTPGNWVRFVDPTIPQVAKSGTFTSLSADLRGTGKSDLVIGMGVFPPDPKIAVPMRVLRSVNGTLADVTRQLFGNGSLPSMVHPREIITGDFNRDGRADIFVAAHGYDTSPFEGERNVLLYTKPDGTFEDRSSILPVSNDFSHSTTSADINGDGFVDIYVGQVFGGAQVSPYFLMGKADGTFTQRNNNLPPLMQTLRRKFVSSLLLDVDGDGFPDLVLGTDHDGGNADNIILLNDGTGDFTKRAEIILPRSTFGSNQNTMDIVAFDVNGDGKLDLLICGTGALPFYVGRFLQVLIANGDGTFRDETAARLQGVSSKTTGAWNQFIRIVDLNGDGAPDLVLQTTLNYTGEVADIIWLNDGAGKFTGVASTVLANPMGSVDVIDIDDDGRPDLVHLSGDGQGGLQYAPFFNRTPIKALSRRGGIDVDGNNRSTLTLRNSANQMQIGRLVNNQFQWTPATGPSNAFRLLGAVDLAGNGKSDLATLNIAQGDRGDVNIWRDFAVGNETTLRQVRTLWRVDTVGDLDGDGFGDLVWRFTGNSGNIDDTGVSYIWFSDGNGIAQVRKRGGAPLDWTLLGASDLNGDGAADMIYISPANAVRALMATPNRTCANIAAGNLPNGFRALKLADFTGNKRGDILMHNATTQEIRLASLNAVGLALPTFGGAPDDQNASCTPGGSLAVANTPINVGSVSAGWEYLASGDFDGDGVFDISWQRADGGITVWLMGANGRIRSTLANAGTTPAGFTAFPLQ